MKTLRSHLHEGVCLIFSVAVLTSGIQVLAQTTSNLLPVVTIQATTPIAYTNPGVFTVFRQGDTNTALNVFYNIGGTASNGVDYVTIPNSISLAAGAVSSSIPITPAGYNPIFGPPPQGFIKTVALELAQPPTLNPVVTYEIGAPSNALVYIGGSNSVPRVAITRPANGAVFSTPTNISIGITFNLVNYSLPTDIEAFAGASDLGPAMIGVFSGFDGYASFAWTNPPPGSYPLTVVANYGIYGTVTSPPVNITVLSGSNLPPVVSIVAPTNGATLSAATNVLIAANASDPDGTITNVEIFAGTNDLGPATLQQHGSYYFNWPNPVPGNYALTAVATDNFGLSTTSAPVNITAGLPPLVGISMPTNGAMFTPPTNVYVLAYASDPVGAITHVEIFARTNDLGPAALLFGPFYYLNWPNPAAGNYALTAVATDNFGLSTTSSPVNIIVGLPPVVRMTSPANGSVFCAPISLPLVAFASDPDDAVASVEFFNGTNSIGFGQSFGPTTNSFQALYPTNLYHFLWTNAPVGTNIVTAVATDASGLSATSAPLIISILPPLPPPSNGPPIVSIVATDPVAVEGTNSWVWPCETNATSTWAAWPPVVCRYLTNCGPKTATFSVHRSGDTSDSLTVPYAIGGTASNGVDYQTLPGSVTIPAGACRALITVVPIDDGPPDVTKTVVLTLTASTNAPPDYVVGFPPHAAAIILDPPFVRAVTAMLSDNSFRLALPGPDAAWFSIEHSTDLINWTPVCTNQVVNGSIDFIDPDASGNAAGFYRVVPEAGPPAD